MDNILNKKEKTKNKVKKPLRAKVPQKKKKKPEAQEFFFGSITPLTMIPYEVWAAG